MRIPLAVLVLVAACKQTDEPRPVRTPDVPVKPKVAVAPAFDASPVLPKLELQDVTVESADAVVHARVPVGWTRTDLLETSRSWADSNGRLFPSTITISVECAGDCAKVAQNASKVVQGQIDAQKNAGYQVAVTRQGEVPGGGVEVEMTVTKPDEDAMYQYVRFIYPAGAPSGAQCLAMGVGKGAAAMRDQLEAACGSLSIATK